MGAYATVAEVSISCRTYGHVIPEVDCADWFSSRSPFHIVISLLVFRGRAGERQIALFIVCIYVEDFFRKTFVTFRYIVNACRKHAVLLNFRRVGPDMRHDIEAVDFSDRVSFGLQTNLIASWFFRDDG